jgi:hypothetical protein
VASQLQAAKLGLKVRGIFLLTRAGRLARVARTLGVMNTPHRLCRASALSKLLSCKLYEQSLPANPRNRVAGACLAVALDHQQAVVVLLEQDPPLYSSAFALVRPVFESYLRGLWLSHCASDRQVELFSKGGKPPDAASLVTAVEKVGAFDGMQLTGVYKKQWSSLSSYTHTGGLQVQRWNTAEAIEPRFEDTEVAEVIDFTAAIAILSALSMASLAKNEALAQELLEVAKEHAKNEV